jgi:hypothetical protein
MIPITDPTKLPLCLPTHFGIAIISHSSFLLPTDVALLALLHFCQHCYPLVPSCYFQLSLFPHSIDQAHLLPHPPSFPYCPHALSRDEVSGSTSINTSDTGYIWCGELQYGGRKGSDGESEVPNIGSRQQLLRQTDASTGYRHVHFAISINGLLPVSEGARLF